MFKRALLVLLALCLPFAIAGMKEEASAGDPVVLITQPELQAGYVGTPDLSSNSGNFLIVSGNANFSLPGGGTADPGQLLLQVFFEENPVAGEDDVRIALFDGDTKGLWDQRDDMSPVGSSSNPKPFNTRFRLYPDADGSVAKALAENSQLGDPTTPAYNATALSDGNPATDTLFALPSTWTRWEQLSLGTFANPGKTSAEGWNEALNGWRYVVRVSIEKMPSATRLTGYEINGFKLALGKNGYSRLVGNSILGFMGGAIDLREQRSNGLYLTEDPWTDDANGSKTYFDPWLGATTTNTYDGVWRFPFLPGCVGPDGFQFLEADADWNAPIASGATDLSPTGIPPDDGGSYFFAALNRVVNNLAYKIPVVAADIPSPPTDLIPGTTVSGMIWTVDAPDQTSIFTSWNDSPVKESGATYGHPSYTGQKMVDDFGTPFAENVFPASAFTPDRLGTDKDWYLNWRAVDARNAIWIQAGREPVVQGEFACREDLPWPDEAPYNLAEAVVYEADGVTEFGRYPAADGTWSTNELDVGTYYLDVAPAALRALITTPDAALLPSEFAVPAFQCAEVPTFLFRCRDEGSVSGRVWCDDNDNGSFDTGEQPLGPATMWGPIQILINGEGTTPDPATTTTGTDANGFYVFTGLAPGTYKVTLNTGSAPIQDCWELLPSGNGVLSYVFEVVDGTPILNKDFRYDCNCKGSLSGHVWREKRDCDDPDDGLCCTGEYDATDEPINGVTVRLLDADDGDAFLMSTTTADVGLEKGYYEFLNLDPGNYTVEILVGQTAVARLKASVPPAVGGSAKLEDVPVPADTDVEDQDFFFCPGALSVKVCQKDEGEPCVKSDGCECKTPINGVTVEIWDVTGLASYPTPPVGPADDADTTVGGMVLFTNLDAGDYFVWVDGSQALLMSLDPAGNSEGQEVEVKAGELTQACSEWCPRCDIDGYVVRKGDCIPWWNAAHPVGVANVWVDLYAGTDTTVAPLASVQSSTPAGYFTFGKKAEGSYTVKVRDGQDGAGDPLHNLTLLGGMTARLVTIASDSCPDPEYFVYQSAGLWVKVLIDVNCDGIGTGKNGVTVTLKKRDAPDKDFTWTAVTSGTGDAYFPLPSNTPSANGLLAGWYVVSIQPLGGCTFPAGPLSKEVFLGLCAPAEETFRICEGGSIVGTVFKEIIDCNGQKLPGEPGVDGVEVTLYESDCTTQIGVPAVTAGGGHYSFPCLPRGTYCVKVDDSNPQLVNLSPSTPTTVTRTLIPPAEVRIDFGFCPKVCIDGYVYVNEPIGEESCDECVYQSGLDTTLNGVAVNILRTDSLVQPSPSVVFTSSGYYKFDNLAPGTYDVFVLPVQTALVNLGNCSALLVEDIVLDGTEVDCHDEDFGFCKQLIRGTVYENPVDDCDDEYVPADGDLPITEVTVRLVKTNLPPLVSPAGPRFTTTVNGEYEFDNLPPGNYSIEVWPKVQSPALDGLTAKTPQPLTPSLGIGEVLEDQDFGYCPEQVGRICGRVWKNKVCFCDETYEAARDVALGNVPVELYRWENAAWAYVTDTTTSNVPGTRLGTYCFEKLPAGRYEVRVDDSSFPVNVKPNGPTEVLVSLPPGGFGRADFPYCEELGPCCVGNIHKVCVVTKFWVDDWEEWYDVYVTLYDRCKEKAREVDFAGVWYKGAFPGKATGYNEIITLEDVKIEGNWAVVRLCLTAQGCWFPRGFFGDVCRKLVVEFNGRKAIGKTIIRCEHVRPGSWFTRTAACPLPECPEDGQYPRIDPKQILQDPPAGCQDARFLVLNTQSWRQWLNCRRPVCKRQSETCKCGYNLVEMDLDYWVRHRDSDKHEFNLDLKKWGVENIGGVHLYFTGDAWHGRLEGWGGYVTLTKIHRVEKGEYYDLWRARFLIRACDRRDGNPRALPAQLVAATWLDGWTHDHWLELSTSRYECLKTGPVIWNGIFTGVNIVRWLSVEDAAWCPPYRCKGATVDCDGCPDCPDKALAGCGCDE